MPVIFVDDMLLTAAVLFHSDEIYTLNICDFHVYYSLFECLFS